MSKDHKVLKDHKENQARKAFKVKRVKRVTLAIREYTLVLICQMATTYTLIQTATKRNKYTLKLKSINF